MLKIVTVLVLTCVSFFALGQGESALSKDGKQWNFGLPGYVGLDFAVHDMVTVGPKIVYELFNNNNTFKAGVVGDFHFNQLIGIPSNFDFYAGVSAGWRFKSDDNKGTDGFDIGGQVGGRWFWSDKWGLNLEFGFSGFVGGGLGVTMRM